VKELDIWHLVRSFEDRVREWWKRKKRWRVT